MPKTILEFAEKIIGETPAWQKDILEAMVERINKNPDVPTIVIESRLRDPGKSFYNAIITPKLKDKGADFIILDDFLSSEKKS